MKHQVQHKLLSIRRKRKQINEQPELRGIIADPIQSDEFRKDLFLVRPLENAEKGKALQLAWKVFCEFEFPDYAPEGTEEFKKCLNDDAYLAGIRYYGGFDEEKLVGMLGIREEKWHVCFFFVDGEYQRLGIGKSCSNEYGRFFPDTRSRSIPLPAGCRFTRRSALRQQTANKQSMGYVLHRWHISEGPIIMSKYNPLWAYIKTRAPAELSFDEMREICGFPIDHAFLNCKKELEAYGYQVGKISMKNRTVQFHSWKQG